jgi:hypothetical protein
MQHSGAGGCHGSATVSDSGFRAEPEAAGVLELDDVPHADARNATRASAAIEDHLALRGIVLLARRFSRDLPRDGVFGFPTSSSFGRSNPGIVHLEAKKPTTLRQVTAG